MVRREEPEPGRWTERRTSRGGSKEGRRMREWSSCWLRRRREAPSQTQSQPGRRAPFFLFLPAADQTPVLLFSKIEDLPSLKVQEGIRKKYKRTGRRAERRRRKSGTEAELVDATRFFTPLRSLVRFPRDWREGEKQRMRLINRLSRTEYKE